MTDHLNRDQGPLVGSTEDESLIELDSLGLLTPGEVAALLHVDANTVARWSNEGRLRAIRTPGGHRRYPASEVLRLARNNGSSRAAQRREPPPELRPGTAPPPQRRSGRSGPRGDEPR
jgi:excisionase family DNA binding protein